MSRAAPNQPVTLVILQPTSLCNLNCGYCYVAERQDATRMSEQVLEAAFRTVLTSETARNRRVEFLWHAGEPLTVGIDYFHRAMEWSEKYCHTSTTVRHAVQTNGVLVNDAWARFFAEHDYKVGVSIDGPSHLHDANRPNWAGQPSLQKALRGFHLLQEAGINPAVLAVITQASLTQADALFDFFLEHEICSFGFNVEEVENMHLSTSFASTNANPSALLREQFRAFFSRVFDLWWPVREFVSIREIRDVIYSIQRKTRNPDYTRLPDEVAEMGIITVQKNGDVSTFSPELAGAKDARYGNFVVGNVSSLSSIDAIRQHPVYQRMKHDIDAGRQLCAQSCTYFDFCGSAFLSNRYFETGRLDGTESTTCILQRQIVAQVIIEKLQHMSLHPQDAWAEIGVPAAVQMPAAASLATPSARVIPIALSP
jgi:uncharacterized protein